MRSLLGRSLRFNFSQNYHYSLKLYSKGVSIIDSKNSGLIFNIQRYSVHDGPGIRTTVFFKGCPLRCRWCSNPESQRTIPELLHNPTRCTICMTCQPHCPEGAITSGQHGITLDRKRCVACGECVEYCPNGARSISGTATHVTKILKEVKKDALFYRNSGGGITVSGGEPFLQFNLLLALLKKCQEYGIHCAIDTCGYASWEKIQRCIDFIDLVLFDLKHLDPAKHKRYTGKSNRVILLNLKKLCFAGVKTVIRIPVIPDFNDRNRDILEILYLVRSLGQVRRIELLPYHRFGVPKYKQLGRDYRWNDKSLDHEWLHRIKLKIQSAGFEVEIV